MQITNTKIKLYYLIISPPSNRCSQNNSQERNAIGLNRLRIRDAQSVLGIRSPHVPRMPIFPDWVYLSFKFLSDQIFYIHSCCRWPDHTNNDFFTCIQKKDYRSHTVRVMSVMDRVQ